ncbi:hypothetical protein L1049_016736 [Liquidambar formosana]|uniref:C2H2-type domain-containing protein n=1 Tax=Liquidambar formosana TaxID=63359 RepID=A0AAP0RZY1_LIQFO
MEAGKHIKSDSSSEDSDRQEQVNDDVGTKRSYECTFCKRGFTNAQALGGHMNIHRKDRAKAKQPVTASNKHSEEYMNPKYFSPISSEPAKYYMGMEAAQRNYHAYFPPSASGRAYQESELSGLRSEYLSRAEERLGANLSLQIGSTRIGNREMMREEGENVEVDLELRLGPDP